MLKSLLGRDVFGCKTSDLIFVNALYASGTYLFSMSIFLELCTDHVAFLSGHL